jgi:phosphoribosylglycinamide formyltransferase-1
VAAAHQIPARLLERSSYGPGFDRTDYTWQLRELLELAEIELIAMAGFGTILDQPIHDRFPGHIVNTHPALLPAFPGWHAVDDALAYGVKVTGCTVHVATLVVAAGPFLALVGVTVHADDTVSTLHERIKAIERRLYPETLLAILERGTVL